MDHDFSPMERNQVEAALINQLDMLARSEKHMTPGSFEAECVMDAIRYTGSALTKVQLERYGEDDPDSEWGWASAMLPKDDRVPEGELRALWGDR